MIYPILAQIFQDKCGVHPILKQSDIIKLDYFIDKKDCYDFAIKYLMKRKYNPLHSGDLVEYENI